MENCENLCAMILASKVHLNLTGQTQKEFVIKQAQVAAETVRSEKETGELAKKTGAGCYG